jgi:hypothetical protein
MIAFGPDPAELREQTAQSEKLDKRIWANLEDIGYGG